MEIRKLLIAASVGMGTTLFLTSEQAHARGHLLDDAKDKQLGKGKDARKAFVAKALLHFKAGEELAIKGKLDRHLEIAFGNKPDEGKNAAVAVNDGQLEAIQQATAEAEKAQKAAEEATASAKSELEKVEIAKTEAQELLTKLTDEIAKKSSGESDENQNPAS
ncbi:hypothetical protein [Maritalea sp.]|jgi:hypothetical protein|uniref:hypothetical protein n=1 Tax=Maritalea sp. TaxID=2003361 RepID=UPI0039E6806E